MAKDFYEILGVAKTASQDEIRKAYYKLAHQHHPHKGGDEAKMKEINEAYGVLGNEEKRKQYDQFGQTFNQAGGQGGYGDFSDFFGGQRGGQGFNFEFNDLGEMFGDLFGGSSNRSRGQSAGRQGKDISADITLSFSEAAFGAEKSVTLNKDAVCQHCQGSKAEPGSKNITCKTCGGSGQIVRNIGFGIGLPSVCPDCQGQGSKAEKECTVCRGQGVEKKTEIINIKIPEGIDNGQTIRVSGKGHGAAKNGQAGDLYLKIKVSSDPRFKRQGFDIHTQTEISFTIAALGGKIEIETLAGKLWLKIPDGTQSGKVFRLKNRGVPILNGRGRGDQLVEVIVKTPTKLNRKQKELLKEFDKE
ncbi:MAG: molecular chaperone DnaJ [Candidatus Buchananbacteria bacterium]